MPHENCPLVNGLSVLPDWAEDGLELYTMLRTGVWTFHFLNLQNKNLAPVLYTHILQAESSSRGTAIPGLSRLPHVTPGPNMAREYPWLSVFPKDTPSPSLPGLCMCGGLCLESPSSCPLLTAHKVWGFSTPDPPAGRVQAPHAHAHCAASHTPVLQGRWAPAGQAPTFLALFPDICEMSISIC